MVPTQQWPRVMLGARFVIALLVVVGRLIIFMLSIVENFISTICLGLDVVLVDFVVPIEQLLSFKFTRS